MPTTLAEKVWDRHVVHSGADEPDLLYIDLHLVHEVTSPQAFDGLRLNGRTVRRPDLTIATEDHNVPTEHIDQPIADPISRTQIETLRAQLRRVRHPPLPDGRPGPGHRPRHRARAGPHAAGHDDRVRRQPHVAPTARSARWRSASARARSSTCSPRRRCRRPGRSRWRSPSTASCPRGRPPRTSSWRHRAHRHGRRHRPRHRVPGLGHPRALDGRPDDGVQHVDRGRRQGRPHRSRRHDLRLPRGARARPQGRRLGAGARRLAHARHRRRRDVRQGGRPRRGDARARTSRGARTRRR